MKIATVCQHYWHEHFQITEVCKELAERGHKATPLVCIPNYPTVIDYSVGAAMPAMNASDEQSLSPFCRRRGAEI